MHLYHAAPAAAADSIREEGLRPAEDANQHLLHRRDMHDLVHEVADDLDVGLPDREDAVYLWPSLRKARRYARQRAGDHVLVAVDAETVPGPVWTTPSDVVESLFDCVLREQREHGDQDLAWAIRNSDECRRLAEEVVRYARPFDGGGDRREAWTPGRIPPEAVEVQPTDAPTA